MKSIRILYVVLCVVLIAAVFPTVSAYMLKRTSVVNNELVPANVTCQLHEKFEEKVKKTSIRVENTGNIEAYIRLRVLSYWQDSKGNAVAIDRDPPSITPDSSMWIEDTTGNDTVNTFYCKVPIAAGSKTPELLRNGTFIMLETMKKTDDFGVEYVYYQVVEIIAEAIQSKPASAVEESWNVTLDDDGYITGVNTTQDNN